jgi:hypothetical protein
LNYSKDSICSRIVTEEVFEDEKSSVFVLDYGGA